MNVLLEQRADRLALYIDGNLQFDSRDERIYHESLALPPLCLSPAPRRVLICGGGDGLALREVLRFPGVEQVDLVDLSDEVIGLGRDELADLNLRAFEDPRVNVHVADAWQFVHQTDGAYDAVICDFTFPTSEEEGRVFTREWFEALRSLLAPGGVIAINGVSPEKTPAGFACLIKTVRAAGLASTPFRVCIPSFREEGYGAWGFVLAAVRKADLSGFVHLAPPVETRQADLTALVRGSHFRRAERKGFREAPVHSLESPALICLLGGAEPSFEPKASLEELISGIPAQHPYHSKGMIEELARQICGSFSSLDLRRLLDEIWKRAHLLSERVRLEIQRLREFVRDRFFRLDDWGDWSSKLFAALLIVMTVANSLAPDNAFGKGHAGIGHSSFSRGYEGYGRMHGAFQSHAPMAEPGALRGSGFRTYYGARPIDIYGQPYPLNSFYYDDWVPNYGGGYHTAPMAQAPLGQPDHQPIFVADDDLIVMDNGDVVVTLSPEAFMVLKGGALKLFHKGDAKPLADLYVSPNFTQSVQQQVMDQQATAQLEIGNRSDWLAWVGWTASMFPTVRDDQKELRSLRELDRKLSLSLSTVRAGNQNATEANVPPDRVELFVGCYLTPSSEVEIYGPDGTPKGYSPSQLRSNNPALTAVLSSTIDKMIKELTGDINAGAANLADLQHAKDQDQIDLQTYQGIYTQNYYDPTYEVDYGTDTVSVSQAITLTQQDMNDIDVQVNQAQIDLEKAMQERSRMQAVLPYLGS